VSQDEITRASTVDLEKRRGDLAQLAQMCALESLELPEPARTELTALDAELTKRGRT
jgi:hypothetical protein